MVYHTEDDEHFSKSYFKEVYFRHNKKTNLVDKGLEKGSTGSIIIPTTEKLNISTDDYIIEGTVENNLRVKDVHNMSVCDLNKIYNDFDIGLLSKYMQIFKVVSVDDNRKGGLQHYKIGVAE